MCQLCNAACFQEMNVGGGNPISAPVLKSQIDAFSALNHRKKICLRKCVKAKDPELCYRINVYRTSAL